MRIACSLPVALSLARDVDDAVGVDVEGDLDLRHAARRRRDAHQIELAQQLVLRRQLALALEDPDGHGRLVVVGGREHLALLGRDRRVAVDDPREHAAQGLDAQGQRRHVEQQDVLDLARPARAPWIAAPIATTSSGLTPLWGSLPKNCFTVSTTLGIRVMPPTRITSSMSPALRPASCSAFLQGSTVFWIRSSTSCFELGAGDLHGQMLRAGGVRRDERQVDLGLHRRGQLDLRLLGRLLQALQRQAVVAQVDPVLLFELVGHVVDDALVEVLAAEEGVAVGRLHLEHAVADLEHRDVERAAAQVVDRDRLVRASSPCRRRGRPRSAR